jgi:hypothetical protein
VAPYNRHRRLVGDRRVERGDEAPRKWMIGYEPGTGEQSLELGPALGGCP